MARIIVYHYLPAARVPRLDPKQCAEIRRKYDSVIRDYPGVIFHGVFVDDNGQGFCDWAAPNVQTVKEIITRVDGRPPADDVVEVKQII